MFTIAKYKKYTKGLLASIGVAIVSFTITEFISFSTATVAIILGMIVGNYFYKTFHAEGSTFKSGVKFAEKDLLMFAIALMGINLNFTMLVNLGIKTILMIIVGMAFTILMGLLLGKLFKLNPKLSLMIGIGNGVCGSSAIAATAGVAKVNSSDVGISIALVNLMGTIGIFLVPFLAHLLGFSDIDAGIYTGNTLQAVGQAVAAGFSISNEAGHYATVVKMGRVLLLLPLVFILIYIALRESKKKSEEAGEKVKVGIPSFSFILWFVFFSVIASLELLPKELELLIGMVSHYITLIAMSAIGLMIHFRTIMKSAGTAFKVSSLLFALQLIFSGLLLKFL